MAQGPNGPGCTIRDVAGVPKYVGFQEIRIKISGGTMVPSLTFEDVDATTKPSSKAKDGWRETMTALGRNAGQFVKPKMSTSSTGMTGVLTYQMAGSSLNEIGWSNQPEMALESVSYASWTTTKNYKDAQGNMARGSAVFTEPIDDLVVVYALTQADKRTSAKTGVFISALTVGCCARSRPGGECGAGGGCESVACCGGLVTATTYHAQRARVRVSSLGGRARGGGESLLGGELGPGIKQGVCSARE